MIVQEIISLQNPTKLIMLYQIRGRLTQWLECYLHTVEVAGSSPASPKKMVRPQRGVGHFQCDGLEENERRDRIGSGRSTGSGTQRVIVGWRESTGS